MANVWYIGDAQERTLNFGASTFTWNIWNGWSIPESAFTSQQLVALDADPGFLLGQSGPRSNPPWQPDSRVGPESVYLAEIKKSIAAIPLRPSGEQLVPMAERVKPPFNSAGNPPGAPRSNGTNLGGTAIEQITAQFSGHGIILDYSSWSNNASNETAAPNNCTIKATVEKSYSFPIPVTFNGAESVTISPKAPFVRSDPVGIEYAKGDILYVRTYITVPNGGTYQTIRASRGYDRIEGFNVDPATAGPGVDATETSTITTTNTYSLRIPGPSQVLGIPNKPVACPLFVGDSIIGGTSEHLSFGRAGQSGEAVTGAALTRYLDFGWGNRVCDNKWPRLVVALSGSSIGSWLNATGIYGWRRKAFIEKTYFTHAFASYGVNDIGGFSTLADAQNRFIAFWKSLAAYRVPVYACTVTPFTASTDEFSTLANQTIATGWTTAQSNIRLQLNEWIRDGSPMVGSNPAPVGATGHNVIRAGATGHPLSNGDPAGKGYLDVAGAVEDQENPTKWKIPSYTRVLSGAASIAASSTTLTVAGANFTQADRGLKLKITGAHDGGTDLTTYITAVTNSTTVTVLRFSAGTSVTNANIIIGAMPLTGDGIHPTGDWGTNRGGTRAIAEHIAPAMDAILGGYSS